MHTPPHILVVDDDLVSGEMVQFLLVTKGGCTADVVDNSHGALAMIERDPPDLLLLDVNLPQQNGFDLYKHLVESGYDLPVIFVTGRGDLEDRIQGLELGDDYVCKPFQPVELLARVQAVLRRYYRSQSQPLAHTGQPIQAGGMEIDPLASSVVLPDRKRVQLTHNEMQMLVELAQHHGAPVSREELLAALYGEDHGGSSNVVDVYVRRLRGKIERDPAHPRLITSVRGVGYRLDG